MKELASLHDQHLNRPTLDDSSEQEHAIEITTQEVTQVRVAVGPRAGKASFPAFSRMWCILNEIASQFPRAAIPTLSSQRGRGAEGPCTLLSMCPQCFEAGLFFSFGR